MRIYADSRATEAALRVRAVSFALVLLLANAGSADAQAPPAPVVALDDRVRVATIDHRRERTFLFAGRRGDTLFVRIAGDSARWWVLAPDVVWLRRAVRQRSSASGALVGMRNGFVTEFVLGGVIGAFGPVNPQAEDRITREGRMLLFGIVGGILGAPVGLVAGAVDPGSVWQRVDPRDRSAFATVPGAAP